MNTDVLEVVVRSRPDQFVAGMATASTAGERFIAVLQQMGRVGQASMGLALNVVNHIQRAGMMTAAAGAAMGGGFIKTAIGAAQFEVQLRNINSLVPVADRNFNKLGNDIIAMSAKLPQNLNTLSSAMYDIYSSGFQGAEALQVLDAGARAATAGLTQASVATGTITSLMNAYGYEAKDAADLSDILFQTVNYGVLNFEQLAETTGEWVSMAASAGIAADEAAAALAAMTLSGMNYAEAATSLGRVMTEFISPGELMTEILTEMGFESGSAMIEALGLQGAMMALSQAVDNSAEGWAKLFPDIRGTRGAMALLAQDGANYAYVAEQITDKNNRAGATMRVFNEQAKTASFQWNMFKNNVQALAVTFGQFFLPVINTVLKVVNAILKPMQVFGELVRNMPGGVKAAAGMIMLFTTGLMILGGLFVGLALKQFIWATAFKAAANAVTLLTGKVASGVLVAGLTRIGKLLADIGKAGGPIGSIRTAFMGFEWMQRIGIWLGNHMAPNLMRVISLTGRLAPVAIAAGVGFLMLRSQWKRTEDAARSAAEAFVSSLSAINTTDAKENLVSLRKEMERFMAQSQWLSGSPDNPMIGDNDWFSGNWISDIESIPGMFGELLMGKNKADEAAMKAYLEGQRRLEAQLRMSQDALGQALMESFSGDEWQVGTFTRGSWIAQADEYAVDGERAIKRLEKLASEANFDYINEFDPFKETSKFWTRQQEIVDGLKELIDVNDGVSGNAVQLEEDMYNLGEAFENAKTKIEALGNVLQSALDIDFGYEEAVDNLNKSLNDTYLQIQDIKAAGTLSEAMDPTSMHEDALALRESVRGIVEETANVAIEWAKQQPNLSGAEFTKYLDDQSQTLKDNLMSMGLTEDMASRYVSTFRNLANDPALELKLNQNFDETAEGFDNMMAKIGLAPKEIEMAVKLYTEEGQTALDTYLSSLNRTPEEITTAANLIIENAENELNQWQQELGVNNETINKILKFTAEGDTEAVKKLVTGAGGDEADYKALVEIIGTDNADLALELINEKLDAAARERDIALGYENVSSAEHHVDDLQQALNLLTQRQYEVDLILSKNWSTEFEKRVQEQLVKPGGGGGGSGWANGGVTERHFAQIAPGGSYRLWAEPETGGEAYIPLSSAKRKRSMDIFMEVAKIFGVKAMAFQEGGINWEGRFRQETLDKATGGGDTGGQREEAIDWMRILRNMHEVGDLTTDEYLKMLQQRLAETQRYSEEWMEAWSQIESIQQDKMQADQDMWANIAQMAENAFEVGDISMGDWERWQRERLNNSEKYSDDWMDAWQKLKAIEDKRLREQEEQRQKEEEAKRKEESVWQFRYEMKEVSASEYLSWLRGQLANEAAYSERWMELRRAINSIEKEVLEETKRLQEEEEDVRFQTGAMPLDQYIATLRARLAAVKMYTQEWAAIKGQIEDLTGTTAVQDFMSITNAPFANEYVSERALINYYTRQAQRANDWMTIVATLQQSGKVSPYIMQDLLAGGPGSLPLARALLRMVNSGTIDQINNPINQVYGRVNSEWAQAPSQPMSGIQMGYSGGSVATLGGGPLVNVEQLTVREDSDISVISNQLGYNIRSQM